MTTMLRGYTRCTDGWYRKKLAFSDCHGGITRRFSVRWPDGRFWREQLQSEHVCPKCVLKRTP